MHIHPAIAALRASPGDQARLTRRALDLERQFLDSQQGKRLVRALANAAAANRAGRSVADADQAELLGDWAPSFLQFWASALQADPLLQLPLRHHASRTLFSLIAAQHQGAMLSLAMIDHHQWQAQCRAAGDQARISFHPGLVHMRMLGGEGLMARVIVRDGDRLEPGPVQNLRTDSRLTLDGTHQALQLIDVPQSVVMQRLALPCHDPAALACDYRLADRALIRRASADRQTSRAQMHMTLLRAMGRRDAAPMMAQWALNSGSAHDRWQAARECLATDAATGIRLLDRLAEDADDQLRVLARQTRALLAVRMQDAA